MSNIPNGYTKCEYIESDGSQWIDTIFNPNSNSRVVLDFKLVGETPNRGLFGARGATPSFANRFCFWYLDGVFRTDYGTNNKSFPSGIDIFERHTVDKNKSETTLDGNYSLTNTTTTYSSDYSLYIFACNEGGNSKLPTPMRLYSCQIYDDNVLVRDYIPAMSEKGVYGLYDLVNNVFYQSETEYGFTGKWAEDKVLNVPLSEYRHRMLSLLPNTGLPRGYFACEYIESDGTNFIDTGFKPNQDTRTVVDFKGLKWNTNEVCMWMGVSSSPSFMFGKASSSNYRAYFYYNTSEVLFSESTTEAWESRQILDWNKNVVTWGGISKSVSSSTFQCADNAYLFAANNGGEAKFITRGRIYSCQIYDNGILVRDYIPCVNPEGRFGLYDKVTCEFHGFVKEGVSKAGTYSLSNTHYWEKESFLYNPDPSKYDGVYRCIGYDEDGNEGVKVSRITINGCSSFTCYIRSWAEEFYDYVMISKLDKTINDSTRAGDSNVKASTQAYGNNSGDSLSDYIKVTYTNIDKGTHTIDVAFYNDISNTENANAGFLLIEKPIAEVGEIVNVTGRGKVLIPSNYTNADYIEGNGNSWMDTGFIPTDKTVVKYDFAYSSITTAQYSGLFFDKGGWLIFGLNSKMEVYFGQSLKTHVDKSTNRFFVEFNAEDRYVLFNDEKIIQDAAYVSSGQTLPVFVLKESSGLRAYSTMKLYMMQIHDNGVFTKFFVPCMKDGTYGLYEMFEKVFYSSEGSSEFGGQLN